MNVNAKSIVSMAALLGLAGLMMGGCNGPIDQEAQAVFLNRLGDTSITVFPAYHRDGEPAYVADAARTIGDAISADGVASVTVSDAQVPIESKWGHNQARMFRESAEDFAEYVKANPIETDYALLPEYLRGGRGAIVGVHMYVVDAAGTLVYGASFNSHHGSFTSVDPQNSDDCTTILVNDIRERWKTVQAGKAIGAGRPKLSPDTAVMIFPVVMAGGPRHDVADVIGLMLEKDGMTNHESTSVRFTPTDECGFEDLPAEFAAFLKDNPIELDYAMCVELVGTPKTGAQATRIVILDRDGNTVWTDQQTKADRDFKRFRPRNPMTCCQLVHARLKPVFGLNRLHSGVDEGRFHDIWQKRSGTPGEQEDASMRARHANLRQRKGTASVLVYPVKVGNAVDADSATRIVEMLGSSGVCQARSAETGPLMAVKGSPNEQRVLWDLARAFRDHIRSEQPDADYALYVDYLMVREGKVGGVHMVLCDRAGEWVLVDFQNEYQRDFKAVNPKTKADCDTLAVRRLKKLMK